MWTDDPIRDYDRYCEQQERELERLPRCSECGERIQDDHCFYVNDEYICENCMMNNYRIETPVWS